MKKILLFGIILMAFNFINAQVFSIAGKDIGFVYVGPKIGMGTSFISNYTQNQQETKLFFNFQTGIVGKFGITDKLSIQPEIIYTRKGAKSYDDEFPGAEYETKTIAQYIGIPILAKYSFLKIDDIKIHGSAGFYTNVSTSQKAKIEYPDQTYEENIPDEYYKKVDFGISIGGGAEYEIGPGLLVGELLVEHGFVDTYDNGFETESNRHTTVSIAFTFLYDLVKIIK